jgi:hypothetical protein
VILQNQDLLRRVSELEDAYHQVKAEHEREIRFNRDIQLHEMELMEQIKRVKKIMVTISPLKLPDESIF